MSKEYDRYAPEFAWVTDEMFNNKLAEIVGRLRVFQVINMPNISLDVFRVRFNKEVLEELQKEYCCDNCEHNLHGDCYCLELLDYVSPVGSECQREYFVKKKMAACESCKEIVREDKLIRGLCINCLFKKGGRHEVL